MMIGTWRWNIAFALIGGLLTLLFSLESNGFSIAMLRSFYAFVAFFVIAYLFRAAIGAILRPSSAPRNEVMDIDAEDRAAGEKGHVVNLSTPDESDELGEMLKQQLNEPHAKKQETTAEFKPLQPEKLISKTNKAPAELAEAVRHLTGG